MDDVFEQLSPRQEMRAKVVNILAAHYRDQISIGAVEAILDAMGLKDEIASEAPLEERATRELVLVAMHQDIMRLRETLRLIADFAVGNGDVCELIARRARGALSAPEWMEDAAGWIVASDTGLLFRTMKPGEITWTDNRDEAIRFARREDAEMFAAEDEDAWQIKPWRML